MSLTLLFFDLGGSPSTVETTPADDDADVSVTARTDRDGATVRPPRTTILAVAGSLANADLAGPDRVDLDAHEAKSDRIGRNTQDGTVHRVLAYSNRAGDAAAARLLEIEYDVVPANPLAIAADTTSGSDRDGADIRVPQIIGHHAANSLRNGVLLLGSGMLQDEDQTYFLTPTTLDEGRALRVYLAQSGRAGDAYALAAVEIEYDDGSEEPVRAKEY